MRCQAHFFVNHGMLDHATRHSPQLPRVACTAPFFACSVDAAVQPAAYRMRRRGFRPGINGSPAASFRGTEPIGRAKHVARRGKIGTVGRGGRTCRTFGRVRQYGKTQRATAVVIAVRT